MEAPKIDLERLLLRPSEAAVLIGVSRAKMYTLIAEGSIPAVRLGGGKLIRVPLEALKQLANSATKRGT